MGVIAYAGSEVIGIDGRTVATPFYQPKFRSEQVDEAQKIAARLTAPLQSAVGG